MPKTKLEALHETIAREIRKAKRQMFKRNREGVDPYSSMISFLALLGTDLSKLLRPAIETVDTSSTEPENPATPEPEAIQQASTEQIEEWARLAVADFQEEQQTALILLLREFARCAGTHGDIEGIVNIALYEAYKESSGLHDDAIDALVTPRASEGASATV